jgi:hypothetical protein
MFAVDGFLLLTVLILVDEVHLHLMMFQSQHLEKDLLILEQATVVS